MHDEWRLYDNNILNFSWWKSTFSFWLNGVILAHRECVDSCPCPYKIRQWANVVNRKFWPHTLRHRENCCGFECARESVRSPHGEQWKLAGLALWSGWPAEPRPWRSRVERTAEQLKCSVAGVASCVWLLTYWNAELTHSYSCRRPVATSRDFCYCYYY